MKTNQTQGKMDGFMLFTATSISIFQEKCLIDEIHHCVGFTLQRLHLLDILRDF